MSFSCPSHCMVPVCQTSSNIFQPSAPNLRASSLETPRWRPWPWPPTDSWHHWKKHRTTSMFANGTTSFWVSLSSPYNFWGTQLGPTSEKHWKVRSLAKTTVNVQVSVLWQCSDSFSHRVRESWIAAHCAPEFPGLQKSLEKNTLSWIDWIWFVQKWWIDSVTRWFMRMIFMFIFRGKIIVILWNWYPRHSMALLARFCTRNPWRGWTWCCPQITPSWQGGLRTGKKQSGSKRNPGKR